MRRTTTGIALALLLGGLAACGSDDDADDADANAPAATGDQNGDQTGDVSGGAPAVDGLVIVPSARGVSESVAAVQSALMGNDAVNVLPLVDHAANAAGAGLALPPTELLLFGNPSLGSQLMAVEPLAGLDLPQKLLAWEDEGGTVRVAYNAADHVAARHGIEGADEALAGIDTALAGLAATAAGTADGGGDEEGGDDADATDPGEDGASAGDGTTTVTAGQGVMTLVSERDFQSTYDALVQAIGSDDNPLSVIAEVDHGAAAAGVGVDLGPLRLVVFGNSAAGTPLMQSARTVAIDLPQKMLVSEDADGAVTIAWNDPAYLAARHGITDRDEAIATISGALSGLASAAATAP